MLSFVRRLRPKREMKAGLAWLQIRIPLWWALTANLLIIRLSLPLYAVPPGADIRPMNWAVAIFIISATGLVSFFSALEHLWEKPKPAWVWFVFIYMYVCIIM